MRVELHGIECGREPLVRGHGDVAVLHDPFALAEQAVHTPVNEHAEPGVPEPLARLESLGGNGGRVAGLRERAAARYSDEDRAGDKLSVNLHEEQGSRTLMP